MTDRGTIHIDESDATDAADRRDAEWHAEMEVDHFLDLHRGHLRALIATYNDDEAHRKLERLREEFWANLGDPR